MIERHKHLSQVMTSTLSFMTFFISVCSAQNLQTKIDRKSILIGEQLNYHLQFSLPSPDFKIEFNLPDSFSHFEILDKSKSDSNDKQGNYLIIQNILLTSWDSGKWAISSFPVKISNEKTKTSYTLNTDSILINVGYAAADSSGNLRDIKPVIDVVFIDRTWVYVIAGIIIALIALVILYRYLRNRPKKEKLLFESKLSAYQEAMQSLGNLNANDLSDSTAAKLYYTTLSDIFKRYYSRKRRRNFLIATTSEILVFLKSQNTDSASLSSLAEALRIADAVKFAKYLPAGSESKSSLEAVKASIDQIEKH